MHINYVAGTWKTLDQNQIIAIIAVVFSGFSV